MASMVEARRRSPGSTRALRLGIAAGLAVAIAGYVWTQNRSATPDATWRSVELEVEGLDCAFWCSVKLQTAIEECGGAQVDAIDAVRGRVALRYDPARITSDALIAAIEARGFKVLTAPAGAPPLRRWR